MNTKSSQTGDQSRAPGPVKEMGLIVCVSRSADVATRQFYIHLGGSPHQREATGSPCRLEMARLLHRRLITLLIRRQQQQQQKR